ncbi:hypothetical protein M569_10828, partial [Genlisea aurea]
SSQSKQLPPSYPCLTRCNLNGGKSQTIVCDIDGCLLRTDSFFPYFMLVAFEGGSIFRAFLLLLSYPLLLILDFDLKMRAMIFITFCGLKVKDMDSVSRAVLPKFYLENLDLHACEIVESTGTKVVFTSVPRVMVEGFLKEYLDVNYVAGTELQTHGKFFTGLVSDSGLLVKNRALKEFFGEARPEFSDHLLLSPCKVTYPAHVITREESNCNKSIKPKNRFPRPLIFHDGRLAFLPTPAATLAMFLWLPAGIVLAVLRIIIGNFLPNRLAIVVGKAIGINVRMKGQIPKRPENNRGILYVCTHRTLLDPVILSISLNQPLTAVTYSVSKLSEIISPIKTVRLTRNRAQDGETMQKVLKQGDLVVCPEGTTCREPYLLRFSSLFAEIADEIVPVAINTKVSMFYGTTASGLKWLDPFFFMMNPRPSYSLHILEKMPRELTCAGGKSAHEVANYLQRQLGNALGFECTNLTRRDKYLMLAGNEGTVEDR